MATKNTLFVMLVVRATDSTHTEVIFSPDLTDSLFLQLTHMPKSPDLVIFVSMTMMTTTEPIALPLGHARGGTSNKSCTLHYST